MAIRATAAASHSVSDGMLRSLTCMSLKYWLPAIAYLIIVTLVAGMYCRTAALEMHFDHAL